MADRQEGGPPSLAMVAAGGVGVLVVIAFVAAVALGGRSVAAEPGERIAVGRADAEGGLAVFVPRCDDDRVRLVELVEDGGPAVWRITSRKGSIDERYEVGATPPPLGYEVEVPLTGTPAPGAELSAGASIAGEDGVVSDRIAFTPGGLPDEGVLTAGGTVDVATFQGRALAAAACPESTSELGLTTIVFALGGLLVVASYGLMVGRWWRGRGAA